MREPRRVAAAERDDRALDAQQKYSWHPLNLLATFSVSITRAQSASAEPHIWDPDNYGPSLF